MSLFTVAASVLWKNTSKPEDNNKSVRACVCVAKNETQRRRVREKERERKTKEESGKKEEESEERDEESVKLRTVKWSGLSPGMMTQGWLHS